MKPELNNLTEELVNCQIACNKCFDACLEEEDVKMMAECIRLDRECADICGIATDFVSRKGTVSKDILEACAKSCDACADECEKHKHMEHCRVCAEACRRCAAACRAAV